MLSLQIKIRGLTINENKILGKKYDNQATWRNTKLTLYSAGCLPCFVSGNDC